MNTASNHSVYARWQANTYTVTFAGYKYNDGDIVYFNPVTGKKCTESEALVNQSIDTGCLKWYAFLDNEANSTVKLLLDHNTIPYIVWNSDTSDPKPNEAQVALDELTTRESNSWKVTPRMITAEEVYEIAPTNPNWGIEKYEQWYNFQTGTQTNYYGDLSTNSYAWLFDNTIYCEQYGCNMDNTVVYGKTEGYWTGSKAGQSVYVWGVHFQGRLRSGTSNYIDYNGLRPVIEINKDLLVTTIQNTKNVTFNSTYGTLPTPTKNGYTFQGWYTSGGSKITSSTKVTMAQNHTLYAQWAGNSYTITLKRTSFGNGEDVYFNPVTAKVCDASEAVSTTGTKTGCMKWYAFLDDGTDTINLLLDHNTTGYAIWNNDDTQTVPNEAVIQLNSDVSSWNSSIKDTARLISIFEVREIAQKMYEHSENSTNYWYYLHTGTQYEYIGEVGTNNYAWLFDNTRDCEQYGCNVGQTGLNGYWTSTLANPTFAWFVSPIGRINAATVNSLDYHGIRPVITINKNLLFETKKITYGENYEILPEIQRPGYNLLGWYTTSGIKVSDTSNVSMTSNHTLYPQWQPITYQVVFDANGGTGTLTPKNYTYDTLYNLPANTFKKTGHVFIGWSIVQEKSVPEKRKMYPNKVLVKNLSKVNGSIINLYAVWDKADKFVNASSKLNVRTGPGTSYNAVDSLSRCTPVKVYSIDGNWSKISDDEELWVDTSYLIDTLPNDCIQ